MNRYNSIMPDAPKVDATLNAESDEVIVMPADHSSAPDDPGKKPESSPPTEFGGRKTGLDPIRYGDWEMNGRCIDF